ncbi:FAD-dependent oxidoreductase [Pararhizobium sp. LjRoot235]|uniref:FAD-dependent oxidoreductase n=1 Tax=Pararhizobium sp. LjRoot235 TaxID=3342291 RepID=UPI003ECDD3D4
MSLIRRITFALFFAIVGASNVLAATCTSADIVVYGGTPAGFAAAVQASRQKKSVILLEPTQHVGGMMSNGLTKTDASPRQKVYGGIVAEFLKRAKAHYQTTDPVRIYFESKWAESTMVAMLKASGAKVIYGQRIRNIVKSTSVIKRITMTSDQSYCGDVFIDASYEGDLMTLSGAKNILGREGRSQYGESAAGVQKLQKPTLDDGTEISVDPYVVQGDPSSGLLPGVINHVQKPIGSADQSLMAFNFRLCVTDVPNNRVPFRKPADYNPAEYETTARFIAALQNRGLGISPQYFIGNGKTVLGKQDVNSSRFFSTNVWHVGREYILASEAGREAIRNRVRSHILGFLWFGQTDPRIPLAAREATARFGFCADEFKDNDNFPRQIYARQGRRLVGQYVMTQNNILKKTKFPDSIGLGYYTMDQHGMIRTVVSGLIADEAREGISSGGPYQIPYRAMLPKVTEVTNLIVPVALSSSHVAYTSLRVEPTYMVLGQAAGAAAALAVKGNVSGVNRTMLRQTLLKAGQILSY